MQTPITTPGRMRHRLTLEAPLERADGAGGRDTEWQAVATLRAEIRPVAAGPRDTADHREIAVTHRLLMRHRTDIDGTKRLRLGERLFTVLAALDPDETGRFLVVDVEEANP